MKRYGLLILFLTVLLIEVGVWGAVWLLFDAGAYVTKRQVQINAVPYAVHKQVQVNAIAAGLGPKQVAPQITGPLEVAFGDLPGLEEVRVVSTTGLSQVTLIFNNNVDSNLTRRLVTKRLQRVTPQLPHGTKVQVDPVSRDR